MIERIPSSLQVKITHNRVKLVNTEPDRFDESKGGKQACFLGGSHGTTSPCQYHDVDPHRVKQGVIHQASPWKMGSLALDSFVDQI